MDGFSFHPYPNEATDPLERGYAVAERRLREPRPAEAGALGRVPRDGAADDGRRAEAPSRRGRLAGRHRRATRATAASRTCRSPTRSRRRRSTASSSARPRAIRTSRRSASSASATTGCAPASRRGSQRADGSARPAAAAVQAAIAARSPAAPGEPVHWSPGDRRARHEGRRRRGELAEVTTRVAAGEDARAQGVRARRPTALQPAPALPLGRRSGLRSLNVSLRPPAGRRGGSR